MKDIQKAIYTMIKQYQTIIIHRHIRPDPDAYGSQCGLGEILKASFPEKQIYLVGEESAEFYFLKRLDRVADWMFQGALVIITDTANADRIDDQRYQLAEKVIKIDHHPNNDPYGDLIWVDPTASATSEMIYQFYLTCRAQGLICNEEAARLLYAGIVGDTGRFLFPSTTKRTFQYASELIQQDFDRTALYNGIYNVSERTARLNGYILSNFELLENGVAMIAITKDTLDDFQTTSAEISKLVNSLGSIHGIHAWVFMYEDGNSIRVNLRSKGPVINELAAKYHGGGHPLASGATVRDWDEAARLVNDLIQISGEVL